MLKHNSICCFCFVKYGHYKCSSCKSVYYCSKKCQIDDWKEHKLICDNLNKNIKKVVRLYTIGFQKYVILNREKILRQLHDANFDKKKSFISFNEVINVVEPFDVNEIKKSTLKFEIYDFDQKITNQDDKISKLCRSISIYQTLPLYNPKKIVFTFLLNTDNIVCLEISQFS